HLLPALEKRFFQQCQSPRLGVAGIRHQRFLPDLRLDPPCRYRNNLFVKPRGPRTVERQTSQKDDTADGVGGLGKTGTRKIVIQKTLGKKMAEQALDDALLQVEVHDAVIHAPDVFKHDWPHGGGTPPLPWLLVAFARSAKPLH